MTTKTRTKLALLSLATLTAVHTSLAHGCQPPGPPKEMAQLKSYERSWVCHGNVPEGP